jgi:tRNA(Ile)-lysidine synthase
MANSSNQWHPFEHQLYRKLRQLGMANQRFLLMVSGGADSVALFTSFLGLKAALNLDLAVLHCHHGESESLEQQHFRDQAQVWVQTLARENAVPFEWARNFEFVQSEAELRRFRKKSAGKIREQVMAHYSVWAHHQDDFLETQLLRLIRGTGPEALFEPMSVCRENELRPFLDVSRQEIIAYLKDKKIEWLEDPSNQNQDYLRNWLRQSWLPALEEKCPGAKASFSRSLDLLQESHVETLPSEIWVDEGLSRTVFLTLNDSQKTQALARYLRRCGKLGFSQNQLKEVVKRLDISQMNHTFKAAHVTWAITRDFIKVSNQSEGPVVHAK